MTPSALFRAVALAAAALAPAASLAARQDPPAPARRPLPQVAAADLAALETRLSALVDREQALFAQASGPRAEEDESLQAEFTRLTQDYEALLTSFPSEVLPRVFYGKLLRRLGQANRAQEVFIEADRLDPSLAVVKQQLGNYLAEQGDALGSLRMFISATALAPEEPLYHYQLGELLAHFRDELPGQSDLTLDTIDRQMLTAFAEAARLAPDNLTFAFRHAEAFADTASPDHAAALAAWEALAPRARNAIERDAIALHRARCLKALGRTDEARRLALGVTDPRLDFPRSQVLEGLD